MLKLIKSKFVKYKNFLSNKTEILSNDVSIKSKIGKNCFIDKNVVICPNAKIGDNTYINKNSNIDSKVTIGNFCSISSNVFIGVVDHYMDTVTTHPIIYNKYWLKKLGINEETLRKNAARMNKETIIGNDVLIGLNSIVLGGGDDWRWGSNRCWQYCNQRC